MAKSKREIPVDVLRNILLRVPSKCLLRSKVVSKHLNNLISDPLFVEQHRQKSKRNPNFLCIDIEDSNRNEKFGHFIFKYFDSQGRRTEIFSKEEVAFTHDCKDEFYLQATATKYEGLVCIHAKSCNISNSYKDYVYIFNPVTKQLVSLPESSPNIRYPPPVYNISQIAFGYSASSNEYKIVRLFSMGFDRGNYEISCEILSFLGRSKGIQEANWRVIDDKCSYMPDDDSIFVNNHFYWYDDGSYCRIESPEIIILDTVSYKFSTRPNPMVIKGDGLLLEFKGQLGIYENILSENTINLYKIEDYENWIWNKAYKIDLNVHRELPDCFSRWPPRFRCTVDGELMFFSFDIEDAMFEIGEEVVETVIFNLETKEFTRGRIYGPMFNVYYETILSLL